MAWHTNGSASRPALGSSTGQNANTTSTAFRQQLLNSRPELCDLDCPSDTFFLPHQPHSRHQTRHIGQSRARNSEHFIVPRWDRVLLRDSTSGAHDITQLKYRVSRSSHRSLRADHRQRRQPLLSSIHSCWPRGMDLCTLVSTTFFSVLFSTQTA